MSYKLSNAFKNQLIILVINLDEKNILWRFKVMSHHSNERSIVFSKTIHCCLEKEKIAYCMLWIRIIVSQNRWMHKGVHHSYNIF